jgi:cytochrome b561
MIGWFMMLWAYDFIVTFGSGEGQQRAIWAAHSSAGFGVLTLLVRNS